MKGFRLYTSYKEDTRGLKYFPYNENLFVYISKFSASLLDMYMLQIFAVLYQLILAFVALAYFALHVHGLRGCNLPFPA